MGYNTKSILRDLDGNPIPQKFDASIDDYVPLEQLEYYATSVVGLPSPGSVKPGAYGVVIKADPDIYQSNGNEWVLIS